MLSFAHVFFLAKYIGAELFGLYSVISVYATMHSQLVLFGTNETGLAFLLETDEIYQKKTVLLVFRVINYIVISVFYIILFFLLTNVPLIVLLASFSGLGLSVFFEAKNEAVLFSKLFLFQKLISITSVWVALVFMGFKSVNSIFTSIFVADIAFIAFQIKLLRVDFFSNRISIKDLFKLYKNGLHVILYTYSKYAFGGGSKIALFHSFGAAFAGGYAVAYQFITLSSIVFSQVIRIWRVQIVDAYKRNNIDLFKKKTKQLFFILWVLGILIASFVYFGSEWMVKNFLGNSFVDISKYTKWVAFYIPLIAIEFGICSIVIAVEKYHILRKAFMLCGGLACLSYLVIGHLNLPLEFVLGTVIFFHGLALFLVVIFLILRRKIFIVDDTC